MGCGDNKPVVIQQFYPFNKMTDTSYDNNQMRTLKEEYFLISNFKDNNSTILYIDSFVAKHVNADLIKFNTFRMYFFKESKLTNLIKIEENPRELDRYSNDHDLVFDYSWEEGKFQGRVRIKDGERIYPGQKKLKFTIQPVVSDSIQK